MAMKGDIVTLTPDEMEWATTVGKTRHAHAKAVGKRDAYGLDVEDEAGELLHVLGARAELAVSKVLGIRWSASIDVYNVPDILDFIHVRYRTTWGKSDLIIRDRDLERIVGLRKELGPDCEDAVARADCAYVLVLPATDESTFCVRGWIWGREVLEHKEWRAAHGGRKESYFVPKHLLKWMYELRAEIDRREATRVQEQANVAVRTVGVQKAEAADSNRKLDGLYTG